MTVDPYGTKVPEGEYRVMLKRIETGVAYGSKRWFGHFQITEPGEFEGLLILRFWNEPLGRFLARSHNLSRDFVAIIGRKPPAKGLKPQGFLKDCEVLAEVTTVKDQIDGRQRTPLPEACHYSKINRLIRITAGTPPCLRKGGR